MAKARQRLREVIARLRAVRPGDYRVNREDGAESFTKDAESFTKDLEQADRPVGVSFRASKAPAFVLAAASLIVVPVLAFYGAVSALSTVMGGIALVALWFVACCCFLRVGRNLALAALSMTLVIGVLEIPLRTPILDGSRLYSFEEDKPLRTHAEGLGARLIPNRSVRVRNKRGDALAYDVTYNIDANGFRYDPLLGASGPPILIAGDSYHFGEGLNDNETLAHFIGLKSLPQPVNIAVSGYGEHQTLRLLQLGIPEKTAFDYMLLSVLDDHVDRTNGRAAWLLDSPRYEVSADGELVLQGTFRPASRFVEKLAAGSRLFSIVCGFLSKDQLREDRLFVAVLREIKRLAAQRYSASLLVLYHSGNALTGDLVGDRNHMHSLLCRAGVAFIDINATLPNVNNEIARYFIPLDGHPSGAMNQAISALLSKYMAQPTPTPCH